MDICGFFLLSILLSFSLFSPLSSSSSFSFSSLSNTSEQTWDGKDGGFGKRDCDRGGVRVGRKEQKYGLVETILMVARPSGRSGNKRTILWRRAFVGDWAVRMGIGRDLQSVLYIFGIWCLNLWQKTYVNF